jgi:hypothetical protein
MVNLSNVTHTYVWGREIEKDTSSATSVVDTYTHASMGVECLLQGRRNCKTTYNKILI